MLKNYQIENLKRYIKDFFEKEINFKKEKKNLILISEKQGGIQKLIPNHFEYIFFEFSPDEGFIYLIENSEKFDFRAVYKIISSALETDFLEFNKKKNLNDEELIQMKNKISYFID